MPMTAQGMNHFTILAEDLGLTVKFYTEILGLKEGYRPPLGFPGAWLYAQEPTDETGQAVLHIVAGRPMPNPRSGVIDHMAYTAKGLAATVAKLESHGIQYMKRKQAGVVGTWQVFLHDPNGARVELDFAAAEGD
jgi:catechol 2,3-dioxygenase-like lactoylglutathione lyase family enzyme